MELVLGERTAETAAIYFERTNRPEIRKTLPQKAQTLDEALADYEKTCQPGADSYGRIILAGGAYIGDVWCYCIDRVGEPSGMVSYCVFEPGRWGQGIATTALAMFREDLRQRFPWMKTLGAFTYAQNIPSVRVLEKNGFRLMETIVEDGVRSVYYQLTF